MYSSDGGEPIIVHIIKGLVDAFGSVNLKIAVNYKYEQVELVTKPLQSTKLSIHYLKDKSENREGGWSVYNNIEDRPSGPFIATPGDIIPAPSLYSGLIDLFSFQKSIASLSLSPDLNVTETHGVGRIENKHVVELTWPPPQNLDDKDLLRDMTIFTSDKTIFPLLARYPSPGESIGHFFMKAIHGESNVSGYKYNLPWVHVAYPKDLQKSLIGIR